MLRDPGGGRPLGPRPLLFLRKKVVTWRLGLAHGGRLQLSPTNKLNVRRLCARGNRFVGSESCSEADIRPNAADGRVGWDPAVARTALSGRDALGSINAARSKFDQLTPDATPACWVDDPNGRCMAYRRRRDDWPHP